MIELTNLYGEVFTINPETINVFRTIENGSWLETVNGEIMIVKEDILTIMQKIINDKFEGGKN